MIAIDFLISLIAGAVAVAAFVVLALLR